MTKDEKIEQAEEKGRADREARIKNENAAGQAISGIGGIDIYHERPSGSQEEKDAYDDAYYNRK